MKHFLPSSVMLTPFVVRHYEEPEELDQCALECHTDECDEPSENRTNSDRETTES